MDDSTGMAGDLSDEQRDLISSFQEITGAVDLNESVEKLQLHQWNLEMAVQSQFNLNEGLPDTIYHQESFEDNNHADTADAAPKPTQHDGTSSSESTQLSRFGSLTQLVVSVAYLPVQLLAVSWHFTYSSLSELVAFAARLIWPGYGRAAIAPEDEVRAFQARFAEHYGDAHPTFQLASYAQTLTTAKTELRFLLVYLHSSLHADSERFCREALTNPGFVEYVNGNMLMWACDVASQEGHRVSRAMRELTYPFLALICERDRKMTLVWRCEGYLAVDELVSVLAQAVHANEPSLIASRADRNERSADQLLRTEQEEDYRLSLEEDKRKAEEQQRRLAAEAAAQAEAEARLEAERQRAADTIAHKQRCRDMMAAQQEPCAGDAHSIRVKVRLPNGELMQRLFLLSNPLQLLYDFVSAHEASPAKFVLCSNFPARALPLDASSSVQTFGQAGILTSTNMYIKDENDSGSEDDSEEE